MMLSQILKKSTVCLRPGLRSYLSVSAAAASERVVAKAVVFNEQDYYRKRAYVSNLLGLSAVGILAAAGLDQIISNDQDLSDDHLNSVSVYSSVTPFPVNIGPSNYQLDREYSLIGHGMRAVSFLKFKVYALGIYIAEEDKHLVKDIFNTKYLSSKFIDTDAGKSHEENVRLALEDPKKSVVLINNFLDSGVRMLSKITPVRNTDFNHLRDGITKTVINNPEAKGQQDRLKPGLEELRSILSNRGAISKDDDLLIELQANGGLKFTHFNRKKGKYIHLGNIEDAMVGILLFGQYLGGPAPLSPDTRDSITAKISTMV